MKKTAKKTKPLPIKERIKVLSEKFWELLALGIRDNPKNEKRFYRVRDELNKLQTRARRAYHRSHKMTPWKSEVLAPVGTQRHYKVRRCTGCGWGQAEHPAGKFYDSALEKQCTGNTEAKDSQGHIWEH